MERSIELLKTTTLVSTVAYTDLMFYANDLAQKTFRPLEVYTVVAFIYFVLIFTFSQLSIVVERRLARSGESTVA
jgi:polar amino acid transport system permease protein